MLRLLCCPPKEEMDAQALSLGMALMGSGLFCVRSQPPQPPWWFWSPRPPLLAPVSRNLDGLRLTPAVQRLATVHLKVKKKSAQGSIWEQGSWLFQYSWRTLSLVLFSCRAGIETSEIARRQGKTHFTVQCCGPRRWLSSSSGSAQRTAWSHGRVAW